MAPWRIPWLRFFSRAEDDISSSNKLVQPLALSAATKQFVLALKAPQSSSVVYILAAEHLSEQSVSDTNFLIGSVKPQAVIVQIEPGSLTALRLEEQNLQSFGGSLAVIPTSAFDVVKECFFDRNNKTSSYEGRASVEVLKTIFGTSFYGHVVEAKEAAQDHKAHFAYLEAPHRGSACNNEEGQEGKEHVGVKEDVLPPSSEKDCGRAASCTKLVAGMTENSAPFSNGFTISSKDASSKAFPAVLPNLEISKVAQQRLKFVYPSCVVSASSLSNPQNSASATTSGNYTPQRSPSANDGHQCPSFALTLYPLLEELHCFYNEMPDIQHSMRYAQKMLFDIESGREVDKNDLAQAQKFRLAVEGLRVALNSAARRPIKENQSNINVAQFENLSYDDKCHLVLVQALQQQLKKFTTVVAVMDASSLAGIRKYWNTDVTPEVALLAEQCFACSDLDAVNGVALDSKKLEKQFAMVGASTVTAMGIASLSWWAPFSSFTKILILKVPTVAKLGLMQTKRNAMLAAFKVMYPAAKVATPGKLLLSPASQVSMMMKTATSAGKARAISHSLVTTAERASLSAIRTAFYCLMRKHHGKSTGIQPWLMLGSTIAVGAGILANGKAIESAIEAAPAASAVARLGRGLENLQHAFLALSQDDQMQVWMNLYNSLYGLSKP